MEVRLRNTYHNCAAGVFGRRESAFIDPVNRLIYSGTWENGLACYDYADNRQVWHRDDLIGIQTVDLSAGFPSSVFVTLEAPDYRLDEPGIISGIAELDARDGSTMWMTDRGDWLYLHPREPVMVIQDKCDHVVRILDGGKNEVGTIPMVHFAIIDVGFSEDFIALAEGEKGVRILDHQGRMISRYAPRGRKPNCIKITFDGDRVIVFDSWEGSFVTILDPRTGKRISEYERDSHGDICFIDNGSRFVDPSGTICRSIDGQVMARLKAERGGSANSAPRRARASTFTVLMPLSRAFFRE
jgi:hypothetical protein